MLNYLYLPIDSTVPDKNIEVKIKAIPTGFLTDERGYVLDEINWGNIF